MRFLLLLFLGASLSACSHSVEFKGTHFVTPTVEKQWSGDLSYNASKPGSISVAQNVDTAYPTGNIIPGTSDIGISDFVGINIMVDTFSFNGQLAVLNHLAIYMDGSTFGGKWQFWGQSKTHGWVGATQLGLGNRNENSKHNAQLTNDTNSIEVTSNITTTQAAISIGHKFQYTTPYVSFLAEKGEIKTSLKNQHGNWAFKAQGLNTYATLGITSNTPFLIGAEVTYMNMSWEDKEHDQINGGLLIGYKW